MAYYNALKVTEIDQGRATLAYSIGADPENWCIAIEGNLGSLICSPFGDVLGLVTNGFEYNGIICFTRVDDLIEDIKVHSGARILACGPVAC